MSAFSDKGLVVDAILLLLVAEGAALLLLWRRRRTGIAPRHLLPALAAGACLLLALRTVMNGDPWHRTALWLGLSFVAHVADLVGRWRRDVGPGQGPPPP